MKILKISFLLVILLSPYRLVWAAEVSPAETAFAEMKSLAGEWKAKGQEEGKITYEIHSNGHTLVETMWDMVSVYHLDGDSILMTHYCSAGNFPRVRATEFASPLKGLEFKFVDVSNLKPGKHYINGVKFEFIDADHVRETWTSDADGADGPTVIELERVK